MRELLPDDVVEDILGHLPVKSLTRFRCVSKSCESIITDHTFVTKHLKLNLNQFESLMSTNANSGYLLYTTKDKNSSPSSKQLCTVFCNNDRTLTQVSSHIIYLWNPSIRMFKKLLATIFTDKYARSVIGLAYNSQNNDFKILRLVSFLGGQEVEAEIYSLSTDSWRKVVISMESLRGYEPNFGTIADTDRTCIFLNGALHTVAITSRHHFILSFDINDESFREIMLPPNHLDGVPVNFAELAVFKGCLAVFVFVHGCRDILCHIWVMEEYGVAESWTRKYLVARNWVSGGYFFGCTDNGELLIKNSTGPVSIDPESQNQNILAIEDPDWMGFTANSMESLILLDGGK
ncbi:hypothetical protein CMV_026505 [Castanea mollissima]|uniref:F-box domain-containing protein n=1 Tax=Castanea mollissima TaxID=60419 RepID=A0A8J4QH52_9ROSI|nr:hypothetical protein CMV_026505 [Castanea mollissima]